MSIIGSVLMGLFGAGYCGMGACMLVPGLNRKWATPAGKAEWTSLGALYPSLFKRFLQTELAQPEEGAKDGEMGTGVRELAELVREDLGFRLLAYLLLLLGGLRLFVAVHWGCGFVCLGLGTCLAEMAVVGHELLRHDAVRLHRGMSVLAEIGVLSLVFIGTALPRCV